MESNSRYSIVERLTDKKLKLMDESSRLASEVLKAEGNLKYLKTQRAALEDSIKRRFESEIRQHEEQISAAESELAIAVANLDASKKDIAEKIKAVNSALDSIKEISKDSNSSPEQK